MTVREMIDMCLGMSRSELENFAGRYFNTVYNYLSAQVGSSLAMRGMKIAIFSALAADGDLSDAEYEFVRSFLGGYSYSDAWQEVDMAQSRELRDEIHTMICRLPSSPRAAFQAMSIAILCVDKRIYGEEVDYLENYLLP